MANQDIWTGLRQEEEEAIKRLNSTDSDRAVSIVSASFVDLRLYEAILKSIRKNDPVIKDFFRSGGPLGSFSAKIDLAYLIGIVGKRTREELNTIRNIRNKFAHRIDINDFECNDIRKIVDKLTLHNKNFLITPIETAKYNTGHIKPTNMFIPLSDQETASARQVFIRSCQVLSVYLHLFTKQKSIKSNLS